MQMRFPHICNLQCQRQIMLRTPSKATNRPSSVSSAMLISTRYLVINCMKTILTVCENFQNGEKQMIQYTRALQKRMCCCRTRKSKMRQFFGDSCAPGAGNVTPAFVHLDFTHHSSADKFNLLHCNIVRITFMIQTTKMQNKKKIMYNLRLGCDDELIQLRYAQWFNLGISSSNEGSGLFPVFLETSLK